jgi:hypothetical protein
VSLLKAFPSWPDKVFDPLDGENLARGSMLPSEIAPASCGLKVIGVPHLCQLAYMYYGAIV